MVGGLARLTAALVLTGGTIVTIANGAEQAAGAAAKAWSIAEADGLAAPQPPVVSPTAEAPAAPLKPEAEALLRKTSSTSTGRARHRGRRRVMTR